MGTLFDQQERSYHTVSFGDVDSYLEGAKALAKKHGVSTSDVIAAAKVLELKRQNDFAVRDGDAKDEQLAGFGKLLIDLTEALQDIGRNISE
ncbi:hypothetical protein [Burkholderia ambifaria]|jgi:hypothetical protein|uniref:hypothetical protein n=1 Tax=Burkholderia ambifaria TaxID=152480 RepID=UPI00158EA2DB|nr:hypothetical protein [Burkholderia ambifaria]